MSQFSFATDAKSEQYCKDVVDALTWAFGIPRVQALCVLNQQWKGQDFVGEDDLRYRLGEPRKWAKRWKEESESMIRLALEKYEQQMGQFSFVTDAKSEQYCRQLVEELVWHFDILPSQALSVLNRWWQDHDFVGDHDLRYHVGDPAAFVSRWKKRSEPMIRRMLDEQETAL